MKYEFILVEKVGKQFIIRLNNPKYRNTLNMEMRFELMDAIRRAGSDDQINSIILTGEGKAFSAGGDLNASKNLKSLEGRKRLQLSHELLHTILDTEKPIIAAVNGAAAGAGFSIALLCDMTVVSDQAFFIQSFVNVGLVPDFGMIHFLPMLVGHQRAKELLFLGNKISAKQAYEMGIINRVVPHENLMSETIKLTEELDLKAPISISITKKLMNNHLNRELKVLLEQEAQSQGLCFQSNDFQEGVKAFFEKRNPRFAGN